MLKRFLFIYNIKYKAKIILYSDSWGLSGNKWTCLFGGECVDILKPFIRISLIFFRSHSQINLMESFHYLHMLWKSLRKDLGKNIFNWKLLESDWGHSTSAVQKSISVSIDWWFVPWRKSHRQISMWGSYIHSDDYYLVFVVTINLFLLQEESMGNTSVQSWKIQQVQIWYCFL